MTTPRTELTDEERAIYSWQLDVPGMGEEGQLKLRNSTALVSRVGGLGGPLAFQLVAAGFGKVILAHGGTIKPSDLNRQIAMNYEGIGSSRVISARDTLQRFNPNVEIEIEPANINEDNAADLVSRADIVFDAAPLFEERFLLNRECVAQKKPMIDCAMYNMEGQVIPIIPGETACLNCIIPDLPTHWKRRFPVIGAVSSMVANIGALEGIKLIAGFGTVQAGHIIFVDTVNMTLQKIATRKNPDCSICGKDASHA